MVNLDIQQEFIEALDEDIFNEIGKEVTLIVETGEVFNERGELEDSTETSSTIIGVPYNITNDRQSHQSFGEFNEGDLDMVVRYDQAIEIDNKIVIDGVIYKVKEVGKNYLPGNVATIIRLIKA